MRPIAAHGFGSLVAGCGLAPQAVASFLILAMAPGLPARAQSADAEAIAETRRQLEQMRQRVEQLEAQLSRQQAARAPAVAAVPAAAAAPAPPADAAAGMAGSGEGIANRILFATTARF